MNPANELIKRVRALTAKQREELAPEVRAQLAAALVLQKENYIDELCGRIAVDEVDGHLVAQENAGCLYWLQEVTMSNDDHYLAKKSPPKAHFPKKSYFCWLLGAMLRPVVYPSTECQALYVPKSRELMTSLMGCGLVTWMCQWRAGTFWVMQAGTEQKALELARYCQALWENQPDWLKRRYPMTKQSTMEKEWANGSRVLCLPGGEHQIRGLHPFGYLSDEAAFQPEFEQCINAVTPVAKTILAISTASPGAFGDACAT